eukprot:1669951-Rhodomonas_salina.3
MAAQRFIWGGALAVAIAAVLCLSMLAVHLHDGSAVVLLNLRMHPAASYFMQSLSHLSQKAHQEIAQGKATRKDAQRWDSSMVGAFNTFKSLSTVTDANIAGQLHPKISKDAPVHAKHERKQPEDLAALHNQFRPEHFKDPA